MPSFSTDSATFTPLTFILHFVSSPQETVRKSGNSIQLADECNVQPTDTIHLSHLFLNFLAYRYNFCVALISEIFFGVVSFSFTEKW